MIKLSNTEAELKKDIAYQKSAYSKPFVPVNLVEPLLDIFLFFVLITK